MTGFGYSIAFLSATFGTSGVAGINDLTSAATNRVKRKKAVERALIRWTEKEKQPLIAGHTHRAVFPKPGDSCYFNDGSCVHPRCITALEIADGNITLVKWSW